VRIDKGHGEWRQRSVKITGGTAETPIKEKAGQARQRLSVGICVVRDVAEAELGFQGFEGEEIYW
jgi:hypothetical protein